MSLGLSLWKEDIISEKAMVEKKSCFRNTAVGVKVRSRVWLMCCSMGHWQHANT
jgi:hypothetical protein